MASGQSDGEEEGAEADQQQGELPPVGHGQELTLLKEPEAGAREAAGEAEEDDGGGDEVDRSAKASGDIDALEMACPIGAVDAETQQRRRQGQNHPTHFRRIGHQQRSEHIGEYDVGRLARERTRKGDGVGRRQHLVAHMLDGALIQYVGG